MGELYVRVAGQKVVVSPQQVERYGLYPGMHTPFTGMIIEGVGGVPPKQESGERDKEQEHDAMDEFATLENGLTLSQSEILDFADGRDNSPQDNDA